MSSFINEIVKDKNIIKKIAKRAFDLVDIDNNEKIDENELKKILAQISIEMGEEAPTEEDVKEVLEHLDEDNNGTIDLKEFEAIIKDILRSLIE